MVVIDDSTQFDAYLFCPIGSINRNSNKELYFMTLFLWRLHDEFSFQMEIEAPLHTYYNYDDSIPFSWNCSIEFIAIGLWTSRLELLMGAIWDICNHIPFRPVCKKNFNWATSKQTDSAESVKARRLKYGNGSFFTGHTGWHFQRIDSILSFTQSCLCREAQVIVIVVHRWSVSKAL